MADDSDNFVIKVDVENVNKAVSDLQKVERAEKQADVTNKKLSKSVDGLGASFASAAKKILAAAASYAVLRVSMKTFFDLANQGQKVFENSTLFGLDSGGIQRMAQASRQFGGNLEGVSRTVRSLRQQLVGLRFGEQNGITEAMRLFGLNITNEDGSLKNYEELLDSIALRMETLAPEFQEALANLLGLDPGTFALVRQGYEKFQEYLRKQKEVFSKEFIDLSQEFTKAFSDAGFAIQKLGGKIGEQILPHAISVTEQFTKWADALSRDDDKIKEIVQAIQDIANAIVAAAKAYRSFIAWGGKIGTFIGDKIAEHQTVANTPIEFRKGTPPEVAARIKKTQEAQADTADRLAALGYESQHRILQEKRYLAYKNARNAIGSGFPWTSAGKRLAAIEQEYGKAPIYFDEYEISNGILKEKSWEERQKIRAAIENGQKYYSITPGEGLDSDLGFINALSDIPIDAARPGDVNNDNSKSTTIQFIFDGIEVQRIENNGIPTEEELIDVSAEAIKTAWNSAYFLDGNDGRVS